MDENHQDTAGSKLSTTEDKLWLPPLSADVQRRLKHLHKKPFAERIVAGKTSWDWIQLVLQIVGALAVLLTLISLIVNVQQFKEQQRSENDRIIQQRQNEQSRAIDQQQQTTLEIYLDRMADLLFTQHLAMSKPGDEARQVARARTLTALQVLNPVRKGILLRFLYESHLIGYYGYHDLPDCVHSTDCVHSPIIDLRGANLGDADLRGADLRGANLGDADLRGADLRSADLLGADLLGANLSGADLFATYLFGVQLSYADLSRAYLSNATLSRANLFEAYLYGADLSYADLYGADLSYATLDKTILKDAHYNIKPITTEDPQFQPLTLEPTKWPQGFDPKTAGAIEVNTYP